MSGEKGLYLVHLSVHGLIRSNDIEMGANPDTGGQVRYVVELCAELGSRPEIFRTDLITRMIRDSNLSEDYAKPIERIRHNSWIVRLPFGPESYVPKENLWPYLDQLVEECLQHFAIIGRIPDLIHGHYADAGYVGMKLSQMLGVPFVFTGHSLGKCKLRRLLDVGLTGVEVNERYQMNKRIEAEEECLQAASMVVTSTRQEKEEQYFQYDNYLPHTMRVIPPGVDFSRFRRENVDPKAMSRVMTELGRFLRDVGKPMILAIARPDEKKNLDTLVRAFGEDDFLRNNANLVIVAGQRDKLRKLEAGPLKVWTTLIHLIDDEDLYGKVAYPKTNSDDEIPAYATLSVLTHGVFVNPAFTEPFGLTLLEAGAASLPVVATNDGGPVEIIENCRHGYLFDPMSTKDLIDSIKKVICRKEEWKILSTNAIKGVQEHYSWQAHVSTYLKHIGPLLQSSPHPIRTGMLKINSLSRLIHVEP